MVNPAGTCNEKKPINNGKNFRMPCVRSKFSFSSSDTESSSAAGGGVSVVIVNDCSSTNVMGMIKKASVVSQPNCGSIGSGKRALAEASCHPVVNQSMPRYCDSAVTGPSSEGIHRNGSFKSPSCANNRIPRYKPNNTGSCTNDVRHPDNGF